MSTRVIIAALAAVAAATPAGAISVRNPGDLFTGATLTAPGRFGGVVGVQIQTNAQVAAGRATACSGAVIGATSVMTAAHCLQDDGSGINNVKVFLPQFAGATTVLTATGTALAPGYNPALGVAGGYDLGVVTLGTPVPRGTPIYLVDTGTSVAANLGVEEMAGLGTLAAGAFGDLGVQDGLKRYGFNAYEATFADVLAAAGLGTSAADPFDALGAPKDSRLAYDFDDGTAVHDVFGRYLGRPGLGFTDGTHYDTLASFGDSGAPHFAHGRIVGVSSFGLSGALFEGSCALPGSVDPSFSGGSCTDSSFGEIGVDTRVAAFQTFLAGYVAASHVPEPASWSLMVAGFGLIGAAVRRRAVAGGEPTQRPLMLSRSRSA